MKILVADDERWIRKGITRMIDRERHSVDQILEAENLTEALELFRREEPEIVLSDVCFPAENGCDLCEEIHAVSPETKIVMISAYDDFNYAKRALRFQAVDYLLKPVSKEQLNQVIGQCIEQLREAESFLIAPLPKEKEIPSADERETATISMIRKMMEQMNRDYTRQYKLAEMAEQCHITEAYFSALFKRVAGISPVSYLIQVRIEKAKELMMVTDYKMVTIANRVGYEDYQYFTKMFKKVTGETPGEYRAGIEKEMADEENTSAD